MKDGLNAFAKSIDSYQSAQIAQADMKRNCSLFFKFLPPYFIKITLIRIKKKNSFQNDKFHNLIFQTESLHPTIFKFDEDGEISQW